MSFLEGIMIGIGVTFFKKFAHYTMSIKGEPLFWIILIGLVAIGIIGYVSEKIEKKSKRRE